MYKLFGDWGATATARATRSMTRPSEVSIYRSIPDWCSTCDRYAIAAELEVSASGRVVIMEDQTKGQRIVNYIGRQSGCLGRLGEHCCAQSIGHNE